MQDGKLGVGDNRPVALITGASGGIGEELAKQIAKDGYDLVLVSRNHKQLNMVGSELQREYDVCWLAIEADLTDVSQIDILIKTLEAQSIAPELIVNNAGYGLASAADVGDVGQQLESIQLNVSALTELTLKYLPRLVAKNRGGIINIGSVAGFFPGPYFSVYYATKAFVQSFTCAVAHELKASNVRICVICPGTTLTGFHKRAGLDRSGVASSGAAMSAEAVARIGYAGYKKGKTIVVTGKLNRFFVFISYLLPTSWISNVVSRFNRS